MSAVSITLNSVSFALPDGRLLFTDLNLHLDTRPTSLVGRNGIGKSVLARILAGLLAPSSGRCIRSGNTFYLPQQITPVPGTCVAQVAGVQPIFDALERIEAGSVEPDDFEAVDEQWDLHTRFATALKQHGLGHLSADQPATGLSGGEHTRLALLGAWLAQPDFLILDEPTNHLDRRQRDALIERLQQWPKGLLVVSHDRTLLDSLQRTVALSASGLRDYNGSYSTYAIAHKQEQQRAADALEHAKNERRRVQVEARVQRERMAHRQARANREEHDANQAPVLLGGLKQRSQISAGKRLRQQAEVLEARYQTVREAAGRLEHRAPIAVFAPLPDGCAQRKAVVAENLVLPFNAAGGHPLNLVMPGQQRIGLLGDNGSGKSTLLNLLAGHLKPVSGSCATLVPWAYLDQKLAAIPADKTPLEHLLVNHSNAREAHIRTQLAQLGLDDQTVTTPNGQLSGGERLKVALAHALYRDTPAELLLLDEPTNHLDLEAIQALEQALRTYTGALIVVSHDTAFLEAIGLDRQLKVDPGGWHDTLVAH